MTNSIGEKFFNLEISIRFGNFMIYYTLIAFGILISTIFTLNESKSMINSFRENSHSFSNVTRYPYALSKNYVEESLISEAEEDVVKTYMPYFKILSILSFCNFSLVIYYVDSFKYLA